MSYVKGLSIWHPAEANGTNLVLYVSLNGSLKSPNVINSHMIGNPISIPWCLRLIIVQGITQETHKKHYNPERGKGDLIVSLRFDR